MKKILTAPLICLALAGCAAAGNAQQGDTVTGAENGANSVIQEDISAAGAADVTGDNSLLSVTVDGGSLTAAFVARVDRHDFRMTLSSVQSGGVEVTEEIEVYNNILHDVYKNSEGMVTAELYIVEGSIWSVTNEGTGTPVYAGFDSSYDDHVRECVFHCPTVADTAFFAGSTGENTELIMGQSDGAEFTYRYGSDGVLTGYEGCGASYEVKEFREGTGNIEIPENVRAAMENRELYG
ncbi:hypothetical protein [uncultured Ruminococcus sp.]|uniref:hypothetical protein n=1 Tax=uncultured Ruminococcus sp. TaxID=165186 RepID=UPI0025FCBFE3|nr:hypothetical protein [uncultured Ruminococcus sp.]